MDQINGGLSLGTGGLLTLFKLFYIVGLLMYAVFAVVVIRQVDMMLKALKGVLRLPLRLVAWVHLIMVLGLLAVAVVVL